jgi:zinc protease
MTSTDPAGVQRRKLPNGLTVLVRRDTSAPVVAMVTYVTAGYFDETDDVVGIAHVLEHMYFKGTPTRGVGEIARQTKAVGGYLNAATIYDHTLYYAVVPSSGWESALDIQADAYRNSTIDADELARELEVIIQEAKRKADNPGAVTNETLYELLHDRHRIRRWRIGREEGLRKLRSEDVLRFFRNFYRPSTTTLAIVGDVDPAAAFAAVEKLYGDIPAGTPELYPGAEESAAPEFRVRELAGDIAQTQFAIGWRAPGLMDPDAPALEVLSTVLAAGRASRLYRAVRERKLAAGISAFHYTPRDIGVFAIQAECPPERAAEAIDATWDQLRRIREEGIGALELERARRLLESRWVRRLEDMEGQANHLAEWEAVGGWELGDRYFERVMTVTADDVQRVAREHLRESQAAVMVYRPTSAPSIAGYAAALRERLARATVAALAPAAVPERAAPVIAKSTPTRERVEEGVHVYRLPSGVPVLVKQRPGSPLFYAGVFAVGGCSQEQRSIGGRTLLMARTAVKGTTRRNAVQIAEDAELLGGSVSPSVGGDSMGWSISVPASRASAATELLADVVQHPTFAAEALETERAVSLAELASLSDDMYRFPMRLAAQAAFGDHPYGVPSLGSEESLKAQTAADLVAWHRDVVLRGSTVIAMVGDGDPDEMAALAASHFGDLSFRQAPTVPAPAWPANVVALTESREKAQTALVLTWPGPARTDMARFDVEIMAGIASGLGGRLFEELRDKQSLCYTVSAFPSERRAAGTFSAYIATSPSQEDVARDGLLRELTKFREDLVGDEELRRAQMYALGTHAIRQQSGGAVLGEMVDAWLFGALSELKEYGSRVRGVTAGSIRDAARRYLDPARRVEGIVRGVGRTV